MNAGHQRHRLTTVTNRALLAFSANESPTVSETSLAYLEVGSREACARPRYGGASGRSAQRRSPSATLATSRGIVPTVGIIAALYYLDALQRAGSGGGESGRTEVVVSRIAPNKTHAAVKAAAR